MNMKNRLYAVLLGGVSEGDNFMEAHQLEFVVAKSEEEAKRQAKSRWSVEKLHVDGIRKLEIVDGYSVVLEEIACKPL
jgi:hypothetical protein